MDLYWVGQKVHLVLKVKVRQTFFSFSPRISLNNISTNRTIFLTNLIFCTRYFKIMLCFDIIA